MFVTVLFTTFLVAHTARSSFPQINNPWIFLHILDLRSKLVISYLEHVSSTGFTPNLTLKDYKFRTIRPHKGHLRSSFLYQQQSTCLIVRFIYLIMCQITFPELLATATKIADEGPSTELRKQALQLIQNVGFRNLEKKRRWRDPKVSWSLKRRKVGESMERNSSVVLFFVLFVASFLILLMMPPENAFHVMQWNRLIQEGMSLTSYQSTEAL